MRDSKLYHWINSIIAINNHTLWHLITCLVMVNFLWSKACTKQGQNCILKAGDRQAEWPHLWGSMGTPCLGQTFFFLITRFTAAFKYVKYFFHIVIPQKHGCALCPRIWRAMQCYSTAQAGFNIRLTYHRSPHHQLNVTWAQSTPCHVPFISPLQFLPWLITSMQILLWIHQSRAVQLQTNENCTVPQATL